jgi:beta-lactamase regulating signal transducer with metallopeptidase domain
MTTLIQRLLTASIETTIAALVVAAIALIIARRAPRLVALLWLAVMIKPLITLAGGAIVHVPLPNIIRPAHRKEVRVDVVAQMTPRGVVEQQQQTNSRGPADVIVAIWLCGALAMFTRTIVNRLRLRAIVRATREPSPRLATAYAKLWRTDTPVCQIEKDRLRVSDALDGPAIAGSFRPVILIPSWMESQADDAQIDWTLRHELRHASAHDTLAIALRELALIAFWFHPAVWIAAHFWEGATELACDRDVVRDDADAVGYADALLRTLMHVRTQRRLQLAAGLFATRSKIGARISALVERPLAPRLGRAATACAIVIGLAVIGVGSTFAARGGRGHAHGDLEEVDDQRSFSLHYDGTITISPLSISNGGYISFRETAGGVKRELRLDGTKSGIKRTYRVNGRTAAVDESFEQHMLAEMARVRGGND